LDDEVEKLELQPVVAGRVRHALPDGELEEAADAVEVGVNPRDLGQDLSVDCTFKASGPEQASENLCDAELQDLVAFVLSNETGTGGTGDGGGMGGLRDCESTHSKIGQIAQLQTFAHQVAGTAVIVDDCTIRVDDFVYDGTGVDVRFYGALGGNYNAGLSMSEKDLRRDGGYDGSEPVTRSSPRTVPSTTSTASAYGVLLWA
jgi:hypothetical protein